MFGWENIVVDRIHKKWNFLKICYFCNYEVSENMYVTNLKIESSEAILKYLIDINKLLKTKWKNIVPSPSY